MQILVEATVEEIFDELRRRCPKGVYVGLVCPPENQAYGVVTYQSFAAFGDSQEFATLLGFVTMNLNRRADDINRHYEQPVDEDAPDGG